MSSVIAIVKSIVGQVFARSADGVQRLLIEGDRLLAGDQVLTGQAGMISLELADGRRMDLGRESQWTATAEAAPAAVIADANLSVSELQQAITAGLDPTTELEATAAGAGSAGGTGGAAGGGHSFVVLDPTAGQLDPTIGYPTAGLGAGTDRLEQQLGATDNGTATQAPIIDNNIPPVALPDANSTEENTILNAKVPPATDIDGSIAANGYTLSTGLGANSGSLTFNADGSYSFNPGTDFDFLAVGESRDLTFTYTATDNNGAVSAPATITITITGTNDVPVLASSDVTGAVTELLTPAGNLTDSGSIAFTDVDLTDTHSVSVTTNGTPLGGLTASVLGNDINWNYSVAASATEYLAAGETTVETFTVTLDDGNGGTVDRLISVTITGTNDTPVISINNTDSSSAALNETNSGLLANGTLSIADIDTSNTVVASKTNALTVDGSYSGARPTDADLIAMFTVSGGEPSTTAQDNPHGINWAFNSGSQAFDAIPAGQTLILHYTVRATDSSGAFVEQPVTITITGSNDAPTATADTARVTEDAADQAGLHDSNPATSIIAGNVLSNDSDADTDDTRSVTGVAAGTPSSSSGGVASAVAGTYGSVTIAADGSYTYSLNNANPAVQALAQGQEVSDTFTYSITDSQGAISTTTLTVTVVGSNDAPVITVVGNDTAAASLTETNSSLITSGTLSIFDIDTSNTVVASKTNALTVDGSYTGARPTDAQLIAMFTASGGEPSTTAQDNPHGINWAFNSGSQAFDAIPAGQTLVLHYTVRATDSSGAFVEQPVTITITGTNDTLIINDDSRTIAENASGAARGGNVLSNDTIDPDFGSVTRVTSFSLDKNGDGIPDTFTLAASGSAATASVTITSASGGTLGILKISTNGDYSFAPHQGNYSGPVPEITYTATSTNGDSDSAKLNITVTPVADYPTWPSHSGVTTNEDTQVTLNLKLPSTTDAIDQNGSLPGDHGERLGFITLTNVAGGVQIYKGDGTTLLFTGAYSTMRVAIVDETGALDTAFHYTNLTSDANFAAAIKLTRTEFEALKASPSANQANNVTMALRVTSYETDDNGNRLEAIAGQQQSRVVSTEVLAVTDAVDLKINGSDAPYTVTIAEDKTLDLKALLTATFQDLDGSEQRGIIISNPLGNGTIFVNGTAVLGGNSVTIAASAPGNTLGTSQSGFPAIDIRAANNFSGDLNGITVTLSAKDTDIDSPTAAPFTLTDSVTLNLHVTPVAGDVAVNNVSTPEDSGVKFLQNLALTDTDGSESISGITIKALPSGWTLHNDLGALLFTGNGVTDYVVSADAINSGSFHNYTATPPAHNSSDINLSLAVSSVDTQTVNGVSITDSKTVTLSQKLSVIAVAEQVGGDSNHDGIPDLTINPNFTYTATQGVEDQWFILNSDGFQLKSGWSNQDADGSEQTFALLTPQITGESAIGSQFKYTDGTGTHILTFTGSALQIPLSALNTVEFMAPANVAGSFQIQVQALTIDTDPNGGAPVQAISGSATLTNLVIAPVADAVTLAVDAPAVGLEDNAIPIHIRPTSTDSSETFSITIGGIPAGASIHYNGVLQTVSAGSVLIDNFSASIPLTITPPLNSNVDIPLSISAVSVDTSGGITSTSAATVLPLLVDVRGVADPVTLNLQTLQTSEAVVDGNSQKIALAGAILSVTPVDNDGSEAVDLVISGVPVGVNIAGLTFIGGVGTERIWSGTPAQIASANLLIKEAHFSGTINFNVRAVSTENDGNSLSGANQTISVQVTPSPEAILVAQTTVSEDVRSHVDFSLQAPNVDSNETLDSVWIKAADVDGQPFSLFIGSTALSSAVTVNDGWYKLSDAQASNVFVQSAKNSDTDFSLTLKYEIRDPSSDGSLAATVSQFDGMHTVIVKPVTDPTISSNDYTDAIISGTTIVDVKVTVSQQDDSAAGGEKDIDGSEKLLYFIIDNVPIGVTVLDANYIGNTPGNDNTGRWILNISDLPFTSATVEQTLRFSLDGTSSQLSNLNLPISIIAHTQDGAGNLLTSTTSWILQTAADFIDSQPSPSVPAALIDTWVTDPVSVTMTEDTATALSAFVDAQISGNSPYAITLTGLPAGSLVSGMTLTAVNGVSIWTAQGNGGDASLQTQLASISITPPANWNDNQGPFSFTSTLTTYDDGGGRHDASLTVTPPVVPVSDAIDLTISAATVNEESPTNILLNLANPEDGAASQVQDGKVYIHLNESAIDAAGTLTFGGATLLTEAVSGVAGVPDGNYYVLNGVTSNASLAISYQGAVNASGTVSYTAYVQGHENGASNVTTSQISGTFDVLPVNDGPTIAVPSDVIGTEDQRIPLAIDVSLTDASEVIASVTLSNVPDGVLVFAGNDALGSQAINLGSGNWAIALISGALPTHISLLPPPNWSGLISGLQLGIWSGEAGIDPSLTTTSINVLVNGVADGISITPTLSFGTAGEIVALNLNSTMIDHDGSELATLTIKNLGAHATFHAEANVLAADYNLATDTYTLSGLTYTQVNDLGVTQKGGSYDLQVSAFTTDSPGSSQSAISNANLHLDLAGQGAGVNLLGDVNDNILLGSAGNDSLTGGAGNDTLTGGIGADTFIWRANDTGNDLIVDFNSAAGDRIDLHDLLQGETEATIGNFLQMVTNAGSTTLLVSSTGHLNDAGGAAANSDVSIKLDNIDFSSTSINSLIAGADPIIKVDHS